MYIIKQQFKTLINTDPLRRCYNGCHFKSELVTSNWEDLERCKYLKDAEERLIFWKELNDYAVSQRGEGARRNFKVVKQ